MNMIGIGVTQEVLAKYFNLVLQGEARDWLLRLPPKSINSWEELKDKFLKRFQIEGVKNLRQLVQKENESTSEWIKQVTWILDSAKDITAQSEVQVMRKNCGFEPPVRTLSRTGHKINSFDQLLATTNKHAETDKMASGSSPISKETERCIN